MDTSRGITRKEFQEVLTAGFHSGITGEFYSNLFNFNSPWIHTDFLVVSL